jgi:hypothetical protein
MISEKQVKVVRQEQIDPVQSLFYKNAQLAIRRRKTRQNF